MLRVLTTPIGIGCQREDTAQSADGIIRPSRSEERAVPAIVLDNEDTHQKRACWYGQQQRHDVGQLQRPVHERAGRYKQSDGVEKLKEAGRDDWLFKRFDGGS